MTIIVTIKNMAIKKPTTKQAMLDPSKRLRLPIFFTAGVLSTGLLLSGCSDNDVDTESADTPAAVATPDDDTNQADDMSADAEQIDADAKDNIEDNANDETTIDSENINPITAPTTQKSLVSNPTQTGTPEDTVKKALNSLYYGDVSQAATYYKVDMANFEAELAKTQSAFQQTVDGVTITDTKYNDDKTRATITGELMLKGQSEPAPLTYELQKVDGQWKILG